MAMRIADHQFHSNTHKTYDVVFFDDTIHATVTHDPAAASRWISDLGSDSQSRLIVGLDVEWRPSFVRNSQNPAATLQLCVGRRCLIFQLIHSPTFPRCLIDFLSDPKYTFVGVGIKSDLQKIEKDYRLALNVRPVDLRGLAADVYKRKELNNTGLKGLAKIVLEKEVKKPKSVTMSRWDSRLLSPNQVQYACVDAFVSYEIGRILRASRGEKA